MINDKEHIWKLFVNEAEADKSVVDVYDRVPSVLNNAFLTSPVVSQYLFNMGFKPSYPENKKFAVVISHDVDSLSNDELKLTSVKHAGGIKSALHILTNEIGNSFKIKASKKSPNYIPNGFRILLEIEKKYGIPASYYFLSLNPGEEDFNYNLHDIQHVFEAVKRADGEIGLHGGHLAYSSFIKIEAEKKLLEAACDCKITGYRNHYLRFDRNITWSALAESKFLYDTTYGDAYCPGFRNGLCYPFQPYDIIKKSFIDIIEIPLIYMDCSSSKYMFLTSDSTWHLFCALVEKVRKVNGVFTLLWHNTTFNAIESDFYLRAVDYLSKLDPWFATSHQVAEHYRESNYLQTINNMLINSSHD